MKISRITVVNYANVRDFDIQLGGHAVLVGPNGSGKSSILRLLDATLAWLRGRLQSELGVEVLRDPTLPLVCRVVLNDFSDDDQAAFPDEIAIGNTAAESTMTVEVTVACSPTDPTETDVGRNIVQPGVHPIQVANRHLEGLGWRLIEAGRNPDRDLSPDGSGVLGQLIRATDLGDDEDAVRKALETVDAALITADSVKTLRRAVASGLSEVLPHELSADQVSVRLSTDRNPLRSVSVLLESSGGAESRPLAAQSDGMRSLAVMSLRLLGRGGDLITAVDEPEAHLDTRSQARIGRLFSSASGQRIVATHSPIVVRQFSPASVVALTESGVRRLSTDSVTKNPKFFSRWWVESMIEPLVSSALILVEGTSDEILVRRVAYLMGVDLDAFGISVVELGGANDFPNAIQLFGPDGFDIRLLALVDVTEQRVLADALGVEENELDDHDVVCCDYDLEDEYVRALTPNRVAAMLTATGTVAQTMSEGDVLGWCQAKKNKVRAALAVASEMTVDEAKSITPVATLIERASLS